MALPRKLYIGKIIVCIHIRQRFRRRPSNNVAKENRLQALHVEEDR